MYQFSSNTISIDGLVVKSIMLMQEKYKKQRCNKCTSLSCDHHHHSPQFLKQDYHHHHCQSQQPQCFDSLRGMHKTQCNEGCSTGSGTCWTVCSPGLHITCELDHALPLERDSLCRRQVQADHQTVHPLPTGEAREGLAMWL